MLYDYWVWRVLNLNSVVNHLAKVILVAREASNDVRCQHLRSLRRVAAGPTFWRDDVFSSKKDVRVSKILSPARRAY